MNQSIDQVWQQLSDEARLMKKRTIQQLFVEDPNRVQQCSLEFDHLYLDYSKNLLTPAILAQLVKLAELRDMSKAIHQLLTGEVVNYTENRAAWHSALRQPDCSHECLKNTFEQKQKMFEWVHQIEQHQWQGATGKAITQIVNLGIGGSDLGPRMAVEALQSYQRALQIYFVSNIDPTALREVLAQVDPERTLFIISSKSFTTIETLTNAAQAKKWLQQKLPNKELTPHFVAVTASAEKAQAWGIAPPNILTFEPWVGGRYSLWSTIGLPLALSIGVEQFANLLQGAYAMDQHFAQAPLAQNMPVLLALIGVWYINFCQLTSYAVLPYLHGLRHFPDYLQQLDMESNGKSINNQNQLVDYATGPIVWGQAGTNGQHAFYQLLHQGTHSVPIDFIVAAYDQTHSTAHQQLVANCLAQAQALMQGDSVKGAHFMPGNKPSNLLLLPQLSPYTLGQLLALYEHKIYVQGIMWQINSFDQAGVELGKQLATSVARRLSGDQLDDSLDPSTQALIKKIQSYSQN